MVDTIPVLIVRQPDFSRPGNKWTGHVVIPEKASPRLLAYIAGEADRQLLEAAGYVLPERSWSVADMFTGLGWDAD